MNLLSIGGAWESLSRGRRTRDAPAMLEAMTKTRLYHLMYIVICHICYLDDLLYPLSE